jgi:hypothetical protein
MRQHWRLLGLVADMVGMALYDELPTRFGMHMLAQCLTVLLERHLTLKEAIICLSTNMA